MRDDRSGSKDKTPFRKKAEKRLSQKPQKKPSYPSDPLTLVYELEVHQIEIEMQNEKLRRAWLELEASREVREVIDR